MMVVAMVNDDDDDCEPTLLFLPWYISLPSSFFSHSGRGFAHVFAFVLAGGQDLDDEGGYLKCKIKINPLPANLGHKKRRWAGMAIRAPFELIN